MTARGTDSDTPEWRAFDGWRGQAPPAAAIGALSTAASANKVGISKQSRAEDGRRALRLARLGRAIFWSSAAEAAPDARRCRRLHGTDATAAGWRCTRQAPSFWSRANINFSGALQSVLTEAARSCRGTFSCSDQPSPSIFKEGFRSGSRSGVSAL